MNLSASVDARLVAAFDRTWTHIASTGSFFSGAERIEIATVARAKRQGEYRPATTLAPAVIETVETIADDAGSITADWVLERERDGISGAAYVELLAVTSFTVVADTFTFGTGQPPHLIPAPQPGAPTGLVDDRAKVQGGWVPTVGPAFPPTGFSVIPAEHDVMHMLHAELYISVPKMFDLDLVRDGLRRDQMEILAARTSLLNDCFF
jgi:hypothetical protein